jgi:hypothetical protein
MPRAADWAGEHLAEIDHKREILAALRETLESWERDVDWTDVPSEKQAALLALAEESVTTLQEMIARLVADIRARLDELGERGAAPNGDV